MVDFSKLMAMSPEEREERRAEQDRRAVEKDLAERAEAATDMRRLRLSEDPDIRFDRAGFPYAILRSEREGEPYVSVAKPVHGEDDRSFVKRLATLEIGDEFVAHGHEETRRWKDQRNNWRSSKEFQVDVPISPEALKPVLPDGVVFPPSAFARRQQMAQGGIER